MRKFKLTDSTMRGTEKDLRYFCLFLRNPYLADVTLQQIMEYYNQMKDIGWQHNSFVSKCNAIRKFIEYCHVRGLTDINERLLPVVEKKFKVPRVATEEEYRKLLNVQPERSGMNHTRNLALISLLWDTGARNGEILSLNITDVDTANKKALIRTEKAKSVRPVREIFWTEETNKLLTRWIETRERAVKNMVVHDRDALFLSLTNSAFNNTRGHRLRQSSVCEVFRRYSISAGLKSNLNPHSMRHHMGRQIIEKGGANSDVTNILGHSTIESSMVYTMMYGPQAEKRYRKLVGK